MTPTEFILIFSGLGLGLVIGFAIATFITACRIRVACKASWAAAERFYRHRNAELSTR